MIRFRSHHYPESRSRFRVVQDYAMFYYAGFLLVGLFLIFQLMIKGFPILLPMVGLVAVALLFGNAMSYVKLRKSYAEIFFLPDHFSLISVHQILFEEESRVFPLAYANAHYSENELSFHFNDEVITLYRKDWDDFDQIWQHFANSGVS